MRFDLFNHEISNVHAAALILGAAGLVSRLLGVLRDRLLAAHFGAGRELDIYYAAFQIPDFMSVLFFLGAGSAAILPIFQEDLARDRREAKRLISELSTVFFIGAAILVTVVFFLAPLVIKIIVPGFSPNEQVLTINLTRLLLFSPILLGFSSIFSAVVQSFGRFWAYACAPMFYNLGIILGILFFVPSWGVLGLGGGVVLGAFLHLGAQFFTVKQLGFLPRFEWGSANRVLEVIKISFPRVLSISLSHLTILILIAIGSTLMAGSIAVFQFAQNLYFLPIGIFGVSYTVAFFPRLSRAYIERDAETFFREFFGGISSILFWILPASILFMVLRADIVRVALGAGAFSPEDARLTAAVLATLSVGIAAGGVIGFLLRGFYALENTWRPLGINIFSSLVSIIIAYALLNFLAAPSRGAGLVKEVFEISDLDGGVVGLAFGYTAGLLLNVYLLYRSLIRLAVKYFGVIYRFPLLSIARLFVAALGGGGAAYIISYLLSGVFSLELFWGVLLHGFLAGAAGFSVYLLILFFLGSEEVFSFWIAIERRLFHLGVLPKGWDGDTTR